ncbi:MAG TPA: DUF3616 domain-containing protein, partial [Micropepsaceae bacterium]|nr:DUF3616 domain-containing protein [Micropepsaceae bacterium]
MAGKNQKTSSIWLDYREAATRKLLCNISTATMAGPYLWTASDEGRTVECLEPHKDGFRLRQQIRLDDVFASLPGRANHDEADIEAISVSRGMLWICGSHSRVRRNRVDLTKVDPRFRSRPSRCLLGVVALKRNGGGIAGPGAALPFRGIGSLRTILSANAYIAPFVNLPNKENGLEIEGLCVSGRRLFLGLRGPLVDSIAIAIELKATPQAVGKHGKPITHFLNLDGLGIRDLAVHGAEIIV